MADDAESSKTVPNLAKLVLVNESGENFICFPDVVLYLSNTLSHNNSLRIMPKVMM